ncbi:hypothetical protein QYE76_019075 [Lolium multiflorum]|uniref:CCHC-type domain-containing protein n=1 Tax=Lolium multiflorum TaxID=4521 RepID=A0AAD8R6A6_LOLMU|nr:hypothetical protein QYE76_019075 [Lolium multiflorum]
MENHYILYLKLDMEDKEVHLKPDMDMEVNLRLDMEVNLRLDMEVMQGHTMLVESEPQGAGKDTIFAELIEEAKRAASDGGTMSRFSLTVKLLQAKSYYRISNVAFNAILLILALQYPTSSIPKSYEEALSIIGRLGLGYDSIHVCPNNCVLFRKDYAKENNCPKCKASRWKDADGRRQIPEKVLRHFPLIPRLQRMFLSKEQSKEVQWHKLKRQDVENDLSHPADGDAWKDFDNIHKDFAADARNIRLGLATDGFNPYGNMSNSYSMWPVFVVPYNLPPWACMDQSNFMLALLIPGPSSPGKDFDVFMEPLMEELQELWKGVKSFLVVNYHEGSSSGTAGDDGGSGNGLDQQGDRFDGVFRAGRNTNVGGRGRFNSGYGFDRGYNRHNFNGQGLTAAQALLVKEAAAAFAKQIAGMQQMGAQPGSTPMHSEIPTKGAPAVNSTSNSMRPEATLLAVAGLSAPPVPTVASPREASGDVPLAKKKKASTCFRCDQPGHCLNDCNAVICECCQDPQHATRDCPLLLAPKPTMVMYGLAHEELMFWDTPLSNSVRPRLENTRMGRVTISGGQMTVEEIITQLRWIVPEENYQWEVVQMEENVYRVNFPSKMDLMDVRVQDDFFRLRFEVEGLQPFVPQDTTMADAPNGDGDMEHDGHADDSVHDATKETAPDEQANNTNNSNAQNDTFMPPGQRNLTVSPIQFGSYGTGNINKGTQSGGMIEQVDVMDGANELEYVFSEVADDRMSGNISNCAAPADNHGAVTDQPIMHGAVTAQPIMHGAMLIGGRNAPTQHKIHGATTTHGDQALPYSTISTSIGGTHDVVLSAAVQCAGEAHVITPSIRTSTNAMPKVMGVSPIIKPSMEEVISFGGISRGSDMGIRSSDRIRAQPNADATQMERAMDLAQRRDDPSGQAGDGALSEDDALGALEATLRQSG